MKLLGLTSFGAYLHDVIETAGTSSQEMWFCWLGSQPGRTAIVPVRGSVVETITVRSLLEGERNATTLLSSGYLQKQ